MKEISATDAELIIKKQCEFIDVDPEKLDFTARDWYTQHTWFPEEESAFIDWVADFLVKKKYTDRRNSVKRANQINAFYGWKTSKDRCPCAITFLLDTTNKDYDADNIRFMHHGKQIGYGYQSKETKLIHVVKCPECSKENYAMQRAVGPCAFCGYNPNKV